MMSQWEKANNSSNHCTLRLDTSMTWKAWSRRPATFLREDSRSIQTICERLGEGNG